MEALDPASPPLEALVIGRAGADFPPDQIRTPLERVQGFARSVGGFGGNVATGLARLGVRTALVAAVGGDGHGRFIRDFLGGEGIDIRWLRVVDGHRTALAFFEVWPPDHFPVSFYPSTAYWALEPDHMPWSEIDRLPMLVASGTVLAHDPLRSSVRALLEQRFSGPGDGLRNLLDLDWRPALWDDPAVYREQIGSIAHRFDVAVGGQAEFDAAGLDPEVAAREGTLVLLKRGEDGSTILRGDEVIEVEPVRVDTLCGLGSGDAFIAAFAESLLRGADPIVAATRANTAGALVATRLACSTAMPTAAELDAFMTSAHATDAMAPHG
jgi:5-dehydro-2-deoxygluconokinase